MKAAEEEKDARAEGAPGSSASAGDPGSRPLSVLVLLLLAMACWAASFTAATYRIYFRQEHLANARFSVKAFPPLTDRLVVVVVDSVPFSMAFDQRSFPFLSSLRESGTWGMAWSAEPTMTSVMIEAFTTGNWPFMWTVIRDWRMQELPHETWLDGLRNAGLAIEAYGDIPWGEQTGTRALRHYTLAEESKHPSGMPIHWERKLTDMEPRIMDALERALQAQRFDVLVWHIISTDMAMHDFFRDSDRTSRVLRWADEEVAALWGRLDDGRTTFLFLSDHGCAANGRHGTSDPDARPTFYLLTGRGIRADQRHDILQIDLASTILALFGLTPNAPSAGRPLVEALDVPRSRQAEILISAVAHRISYLSLKARLGDRYTPDLTKARAAYSEARALSAAGRPEHASTLATWILRRLHTLALAARRANQAHEPVMWWLGFGLSLLAFIFLLVGEGRKVDPPSGASASPDSVRTMRWLLSGLSVLFLLSIAWDEHHMWPFLIMAVSVGLLSTTLASGLSARRWMRFVFITASPLALYLVATTLLSLWTGRICNTYLFGITRHSEIVFIGLVDAAGLCLLILLYLFRRRMLLLIDRNPLAVGCVASTLLCGLNGYYQGFYLPLLMIILSFLLLRVHPSKPGLFEPCAAERWIAFILPAAAAAGVLGWQITWNRHLFYLRYALDELAWPGGLAAGAAFLLFSFVLRRQMIRKGEITQSARLFLYSAVYLALLVAIRHVALPTRAEHLSLSLGHHLIDAFPAQGIFTLAASLVLLPLFRLPSPARRSILVPMVLLLTVAVTALVGSPLESPAVLLLLALLLPLTSHPVFEGNHSFSVLVAAFSLLACRVVVHVIFDFKMNFTQIHDLFRFAGRISAHDWTSVLPSIMLRHIPIMIFLSVMILHRMDRTRILKTFSLFGVYLASRALYILVLMHLSRHQLYLNWRNTGEVIFYGFYFASSLFALPIVLFLSGQKPKKSRSS